MHTVGPIAYQLRTCSVKLASESRRYVGSDECKFEPQDPDVDDGDETSHTAQPSTPENVSINWLIKLMKSAFRHNRSHGQTIGTENLIPRHKMTVTNGVGPDTAAAARSTALTSDVEVIIVGLGIAGLVAAIECHYKGHTVIGLEKSPEIRVLGESYFPSPPRGLIYAC